ncbi:MAG: calcium/sodium antiporter [Gracilimonas sp.]|uniref:calcium/sodium antiporter n=1 Tax=Gracilimonas sp. TaxID=1974203 RepID=UPI0019C4DB7A|nr:calcium/sodium antiporter [Gracilimonas sp.]MBD3616186.1 calcium/sodium antiporter [Gracilimonas sp.]
MTVILFIVGLVILIGGAELFLRSVDKFGAAWSVSPVVMGLTVVAFATGAPELAISLQAAVEGKPDLVLGNILGSNVANILLILGIAGLVSPLKITNRIIKIDIPAVIGASTLLFVLAVDGVLSPLDGGIILGALVLYSVFMYTQIRKDRALNRLQQQAKIDVGEPVTSLFYGKYIFFLLAGLVLIVLGSRWMVEAAVEIAGILGISELIIGLTIVSIGTSLPEVATSLAAVRKGDSDTAVANVMGSNLYNILLTLGLTIIIAPGVIDVSASAIKLDLPIMLIVAIACLPLFWPGKLLGRMEAAGFLFYYSVYMAYLVLIAINHPFKEQLEWGMIWIVIPITIVLIVVKFVTDFRKEKLT